MQTIRLIWQFQLGLDLESAELRYSGLRFLTVAPETYWGLTLLPCKRFHVQSALEGNKRQTNKAANQYDPEARKAGDPGRDPGQCAVAVDAAWNRSSRPCPTRSRRARPEAGSAVKPSGVRKRAQLSGNLEIWLAYSPAGTPNAGLRPRYRCTGSRLCRSPWTVDTHPAEDRWPGR